VTTILVPLVEATLGGNLLAVDIRTWGACFLALAGITVMGVDHSAVTDVSSILAGFHALGSGDLLIMGAALMYTMHVVRLGKYARQTTPLNLAASKATVELILSIGLLAGLIAIASTGGSLDDAMVGAGSGGGLVAYARESGREIQTFYETFRQGIESGTLPASTLQKIVGATLWTGWVSTAYTIYAQSFGQRRVSPTDANLIYSVQPIFTAIFAFFLLGETMEPVAFVGGGLIGAAVYLVASKSVSA
jgi:drug/metabolite transporter (DMT)-like permease